MEPVGQNEIEQMPRPPKSDASPLGPKIFKVPQAFRANNEIAFMPHVVCIGPYNHDIPHIRITEETKSRYLQYFIKRNSDSHMDLEFYRQRIRPQIDKAKAYYEWDSIPFPSKEDFVNMLVLDGCFILEYMIRKRKWKFSELDLTGDEQRFDPIFHVHWAHMHVLQDLFLKLENQVPFFVLKSIYDETATHSLEELAFDILPEYFEATERDDKSKFLDFLEKNGPLHHLLHFTHSYITFKHYEDVPADIVENVRIPSSQELIEAGLKIRAEVGDKMMDVSFTNGSLKMAPLVFNDHTIANFHNFIAFEQCCTEALAYVTAYSQFIHCLVHTSTDVQLLRQAKILVNHIGSDKDLAMQVNRLCKNVTVKGYTLNTLFVNVNKYCNRKRPRWVANLMRNYVSTPWKIISLAAGIVLLVLAVVQSIFSIMTYARKKK